MNLWIGHDQTKAVIAVGKAADRDQLLDEALSAILPVIEEKWPLSDRIFLGLPPADRLVLLEQVDVGFLRPRRFSEAAPSATEV